MNVFKAVKERVGARQAAEFYGLKVSEKGMACCPFHDDSNPSMKLDERYYCFGCHATGDAVDFVSNYLQLPPLEAAKQIARDFGIPYTERGQSEPRLSAKEQMQALQAQQEKKAFKEWKRKTLSDLAGFYRILEDCKEAYAPVSREEPWSPLFTQSMKDQNLVDVYTFILEKASDEDQRSLWAERGNTIEALAKRVQAMIMPSNRRPHKAVIAPAI